ncbi:MAG: UDP-glucose dehydrogenase family protein [Acidimicrobiia bacterium]
MARVAVIGAGYVGLTQAVGFAHLGHQVLCADVDAERVRLLQKGEPPILEERLPELLDSGLESRRLQFVVGAAAAAKECEFVFLCVPTPQGDDGAADMSYVDAVAREVAPVLGPNSVVVNKSTMPVGSTRRVQRILAEVGALDSIGVASNPEFLREGFAIRDFLAPSRIVIGCEDPGVAVRVSELYRGVNAPMIITDPASAEMIKYASNGFLATKIGFINAIANLCEAVGADVREVALGMGYDPRIGFEFLHPGPGYGGSCFPKDTSALVHTASNANYDFQLLRGVIESNRDQHERMVAKVRAAVGGSLAGRTIAAWGLTFKANTDDLRDSPAVYVIERLVAEGAEVRAYDPEASADALEHLQAVTRVADPIDAAENADALVVLTEWDEFRWVDFDELHTTMRAPCIVDTRNLLDPASMRRRGFTYEGVGR